MIYSSMIPWTARLRRVLSDTLGSLPNCWIWNSRIGRALALSNRHEDCSGRQAP